MTSCTRGFARYGFLSTGDVPGCKGKSASIIVHFPNSLEDNEKIARYFAHKSSTCEHWSDEKVVDVKAFFKAPRSSSRVDSDG